MEKSYDELIDEIVQTERSSDTTPWEPEELRGVLSRAARLDTGTLKRLAAAVGISFTDGDADKEDYLQVLEEANDKEAFERFLSENGV